MKKILGLLTALILAFTFSVSVMAAGSQRTSDLVLDNATLLTSAQARELEKTAEEFSEKYECDIVVITTDDADGKDTDNFAKDAFASGNYGWGNDKSTILFVLNTEANEYYELSKGIAASAINDKNEDEFDNLFVGDLSDGNYYDGFKKYITACGEYIDKAKSDVSANAAAVSSAAAGADRSAEKTMYYIYDGASLLTVDEAQKLDITASELSEKYQCSIIVVTVRNTDGQDIYEYAKKLCVSKDFGYGTDKNCVMLLVSMQDRDYNILARGNRGNAVFTDSGKEQVENVFLSDLSKGNYYDSFDKYINTCGNMLKNANSRKSVNTADTSNNSGKSQEKANAIGISSAIAAAVSGIICFIFYKKMKTAVIKTEANDYITDGGVHITGQSDQYLTSTISRVKINTGNNSNGGTGSGGFSGRSGHF